MLLKIIIPPMWFILLWWAWDQKPLAHISEKKFNAKPKA